MRRLAVLILGYAICIAPAAGQRMYRWVDEHGKVHYSERLPVEAAGRESTELSKHGTVLKRHGAALTSEQIAAQEEEQRRKIEAEKQAREQRRKNEALLLTYASEQDIDEARKRALQNNQEAIKSAQHNVAQAEAQRVKLEADTARYNKNKQSLPEKLRTDLEANETQLRHQRELLEMKQREVAAIEQRYDEDKRRYVELTRGKTRATAELSKK